jgi:putative nucleotidyltransferase with HDIG domain
MSRLPTREEALDLLHRHISSEYTRKHCLASEAILRALARRLGQDEDLWGITALLHDLDYEETKDAPDRHGRVTVELLRARGFSDEEILGAILAHAGHKRPENPMEWALYSVDPLTGLIVAAALVHPQRLPGLTVKNVLNRYREKAFARSASREGIAACENLGLSLEEFVEIVLRAMKEISAELGLQAP